MTTRRNPHINCNELFSPSCNCTVNIQCIKLCPYSRCKYLAVIVIYESTEWLNSKSWETQGGLTCSNNPLDLNAGGVQLLGKLMDSPVWVLVRLRVNVGFGAWKFDCRKVRGLLLRLNMHTVHQQALDRQTITKANDSAGITEQQAAGVKRVFRQENSSQKGNKDLTNPWFVFFFLFLNWGCLHLSPPCSWDYNWRKEKKTKTCLSGHVGLYHSIILIIIRLFNKSGSYEGLTAPIHIRISFETYLKKKIKNKKYKR